MRQRQSERRQYRALSPYLFFLFEIGILAEFNYIVINLFGLDTKISYFLILINLYVVLNCFNKLVNVLRRCKFVKNYNRCTLRKNIS